MPASDCQTPPPGPVPPRCPHCGSKYEDGHYTKCRHSVMAQTGDRPDRSTGFDGTYEGAATSMNMGERGHGA